MPDASLTIYCGASAFSTGFDELRRWRHVLNCADAISLKHDGAERVHVRLGGLRRWIAFEQSVGGSPFAVVGYQETVGAVWHGESYSGGSNRKVLAWVRGDGTVSIGDMPAVLARARENPGVVWMTASGEPLTGDDVPEVLG
ncbi:MAG: hypothetical protein KKC55_17960 [Gammaproteobacteria bacterium]|nr:hypothetical protein [Gammaproteobacteria bacterium]